MKELLCAGLAVPPPPPPPPSEPQSEPPPAPPPGRPEPPGRWAPPRPPGASAGEGAARLCARAEVGSPTALTLHTKTGSAGEAGCPPGPLRGRPVGRPAPTPDARVPRAGRAAGLPLPVAGAGRGSLRALEDGAPGGGRAGSPGHPAPCRGRARGAGSGRGRGRARGYPRLGSAGDGGVGAAREASLSGRSARLIVASSALKMERPCLERGCAAHRVRRARPDAEPWAPGSPPAAPAAAEPPPPGQTEEGPWGLCAAGLKVTGAPFPNSLQVTFLFLPLLRSRYSSEPSMLGGVCPQGVLKFWFS